VLAAEAGEAAEPTALRWTPTSETERETNAEEVDGAPWLLEPAGRGALAVEGGTGAAARAGSVSAATGDIVRGVVRGVPVDGVASRAAVGLDGMADEAAVLRGVVAGEAPCDAVAERATVEAACSTRMNRGGAGHISAEDDGTRRAAPRAPSVVEAAACPGTLPGPESAPTRPITARARASAFVCAPGAIDRAGSEPSPVTPAPALARAGAPIEEASASARPGCSPAGALGVFAGASRERADAEASGDAARAGDAPGVARFTAVCSHRSEDSDGDTGVAG